MRDPQPASFDPVEKLFVAQRRWPAGLGAVDWDSLAPVERALLAIDGTVTRFLEAWRNEPVRVELIGEAPVVLSSEEPWLQLPAGATVLRRRVRLVGEGRGEELAFAESLIATHRLPGDLGRQLPAVPGGLGQILIDAQLETRREGLWCGRQPITAVPFAQPFQDGGSALTRTYRVFLGGTPLMLITEWFPGSLGAATR